MNHKYFAYAILAILIACLAFSHFATESAAQTYGCSSVVSWVPDICNDKGNCATGSATRPNLSPTTMVRTRTMAVLVVVAVVTLRRLHLEFHHRRRHHLSSAETAGVEAVPAPPIDAPPAEPHTKAPVVQGIGIGAATAGQSHGMQRLILAPAAAAVRRIRNVPKATVVVVRVVRAVAPINGIINLARLRCA